MGTNLNNRRVGKKTKQHTKEKFFSFSAVFFFFFFFFFEFS